MINSLSNWTGAREHRGTVTGKFTLPLLHLQQPQLLCLSVTKQDPDIVINPST